jgi:hypothetical protein
VDLFVSRKLEAFMPGPHFPGPVNLKEGSSQDLTGTEAVQDISIPAQALGRMEAVQTLGRKKNALGQDLLIGQVFLEILIPVLPVYPGLTPQIGCLV